MLSKSQAAFVLSVEKLSEECNGVLYFWTFTFVDTMPDWYYPQHWFRFWRALSDWHKGTIQGVRVVEAHPGGHGLHYHALLNRRLNIHIVRRIGARYGMGRIEVQKVRDVRAAGFYLAKYLAKGRRLFHVHRWSCCGGFRGVKKNNLEGLSMFHFNMAKLCQHIKVNMVVSNYVYRQTQLYGRVKNWPKEKLECCRGLTKGRVLPYNEAVSSSAQAAVSYTV